MEYVQDQIELKSSTYEMEMDLPVISQLFVNTENVENLRTYLNNIQGEFEKSFTNCKKKLVELFIWEDYDNIAWRGRYSVFFLGVLEPTVESWLSRREDLPQFAKETQLFLDNTEKPNSLQRISKTPTDIVVLKRTGFFRKTLNPGRKEIKTEIKSSAFYIYYDSLGKLISFKEYSPESVGLDGTSDFMLPKQTTWEAVKKYFLNLNMRKGDIITISTDKGLSKLTFKLV